MNGITNQIRFEEDTPLEPGQTNRVIVNTVFLDSKVDRTLGIGKRSAMDVEVNTKIPVEEQSKKLKCAMIVVITASTISAMMTITLAYYHCVNMSLLQNQVDFLLMKMENITRRQDPVNPVPSSLASSSAEAQMASPHSLYYNREVLAVSQPVAVPLFPAAGQPAPNTTVVSNDLLVTHFNGAQMELNLILDTEIGPWVRDNKVSSSNSHDKIELENKHVVIKEGGLYMIYAQIVYLTHEPCCYFIWARQPTGSPRLLATCATSSSSADRPLSRSQVSCATHTVARLYKGDIVNLAQREHNRSLWLRPGYSYFGFVKIAS